MYIRNLTIFAAFLLTCSVSLLAQPISPTPSPAPTSYSQMPSEAEKEAEKVAILQAQLELMRQYDQRLLETVYWSLGGMVTIVVLVAGFGWFANFRLYEHDKKALKQELTGFIKEERAKLHEELSSAARDAVRSELQDMKLMKYDLLKTEAEKWESKEVYANVLTTSLRMLEVALEIGWEHRIAGALEFTTKALKSGKKFDASTIVNVTKAINQLSSDYTAEVENIRELLKAARA